MRELVIKKDDLIHNIREIKSMVNDDNYTIIAVVKGNGYGLDIVQYTKILAENGISFFAVANIEEAIKLRDAGIKETIINLTPYIDENDVRNMMENDIILSIDSKLSADIANKIADEKGIKVKAHIKIDTGLSRYGFKYNDFEAIKKCIEEHESILFEGIFSHFSYSLAGDSSFSEKQFERFKGVIDYLEKNEITFKYKHICNSSGFFKYSHMRLNAARIGSAFTGNAVGIKNNLIKLGAFHTKVARVREIETGDVVGYGNSFVAKKHMKIAILHTGYFDGVGVTQQNQRFKKLSKMKRAINELKNVFRDDSIILKINGISYKVVGQIGMFDTVIDITDHELKENDEITFDVRPVLIDSSIERKYI